MSTDVIWQTVSSSSDDTFAIGERLGRQCKGGELFVLSSELGGGKTTFVKGLASGLDCMEIVGSPSFTLNRIYKCGRGLELHHFDFYRLAEPGVVAHELAEVIDEPNIVIAIEWGDIVEGILPSRRVIVELKRTQESENHRNVTISYPDEMAYLKS